MAKVPFVAPTTIVTFTPRHIDRGTSRLFKTVSRLDGGVVASDRTRKWNKTYLVRRADSGRAGAGASGTRPASACRVLSFEVIALAGLDHVVLLLHREMKLVITQRGAGVGRVAQAVLAAQFLFDVPVDIVHRLLLGNLEHAPAGFGGDLREDFLAVHPLLRESLRITSAPSIRATAATARIASAARITAAIAAARPSESAVLFLIGKVDRVDDRIGALSRLDGVLEGFLASVIHPVREDDQRLAALLFLDHFVRGQENRVIEQRAAANSLAATAAG